MEFFAQTLLAGIVTGSLYSLVALGFVIIYKTTNVVNFAHGDISMLGAYFGVQTILMWKLPLGLALALLVPFAFIVGGAVGSFLNIPLKKNRIENVVLASLGMGIVLQELMVLKFGAFPFYLKVIFPDKSLSLGVLSVPYGNLIIILITVSVMAIVALFFKYTSLGIAMRAISQNREASLAMGISPRNIIISSWGLASIIGMASCFLLTSQLGAYPELGLTMIVKAFTGAVLGGLANLSGAVLGAFLLGIIDSMLAGYISGALQNIAAFIILLIVLLLRPEGIFTSKMNRTV